MEINWDKAIGENNQSCNNNEMMMKCYLKLRVSLR